MAQHQWIYGWHAVTAVLEREPERVIELHALKGRQDQRLKNVLQLCQQLGIAVQYCHRPALDDKSQGAQHQGLVAKVKPARVLHEGDLTDILNATDNPLLLVLDGITDPHNLGACLRTADAAGVTAVIVPKDNSASLSPIARKVACGAAEVVPLIQVTNLARALRLVQEAGVWVVGTAGEAEKAVFDIQLSGATAIVMGAEGKGLRRLTRDTCDELLKLPMAGSVDSLNVSVATGVCLYEVVRQRRSLTA